MGYTDQERRLLSRYFSELEPRDHADIYLVRNLPQEVAATLNGVYSRSRKSMRDNFLDRLQKGLAEAGRSLETEDLDDASRDLLTEVMADKSGQFLKTYAIDHGHNSLREGSIVHLAVENVSQLVTRFIQRERRCSFEESSTRYISFKAENHWRDPDVVAAGGEVAAAYDEILALTFELYQELSESLLEHLRREHPLEPGKNEAAWLRALRAESFDAARYLLTPAIQTKWGMVADARTLSDIITDLLSHPLREFQIVGERLKEQGDLTVRTLLFHAKANPYLQEQYAALPALAAELPAQAGPEPGPGGHDGTRLLDWDRDLDNRLLASLLYEHDHRPFDTLRAAVADLDDVRRAELLERAMAGRGKHDPWPAGLEGAAPFDFEMLVDFGAYRDIGRHRKGFQQQQRLTVQHGYEVPPLVVEAGAEARYREVLDRVRELQSTVARDFPHAAGYVTPFAFRQRVRVVFEPRQTAYFIELRSGPEGHFSYRRVALDMQRLVEEVSPLFGRFVRASKGDARLGRMTAEETADDRRRERMRRAGDLAT